MTLRIVGAACVLAALVGGGAVAQITPCKERADLMHQQLCSVMGAHDSIIRGNLDGAKNEARIVSRFPDPVGLPPQAAPYLVAMRSAATRVSEAPNLQVAASATASMLATCGDCHRAVGTMPAHEAPPEPSVGGVIGHMLTHRAALDLLLQGLTTPSTSLWNQGAEALAVAPLAKDKLPSDAKVGGELMKSEKQVHALAERARRADDTPQRVAVYGELIQSCGTCHRGNAKAYGPSYR